MDFTCEEIFQTYDCLPISNELTNAQTFFFLISFIPLASLFGFWVVAFFVYAPYRRYVENEGKYIPPVIVIPYEEKYPLSEISDISGNSPTYEHTWIMEKTPDGGVILRYDDFREGFVYYSDTKIQYKYLETVARKYVKTYNCKHLYIDRETQIKEKKQKIEDDERREKEKELMKKEDKEQKEEKEQFSVFANIKSNKQKDEEKQKNKKDKTIVADTANKYIHLGKFKDNEITNTSSINVKTEKKLSFADFMKLKKNN